LILQGQWPAIKIYFDFWMLTVLYLVISC
jgi:hypothetical protein